MENKRKRVIVAVNTIIVVDIKTIHKREGTCMGSLWTNLVFIYSTVFWVKPIHLKKVNADIVNENVHLNFELVKGFRIFKTLQINCRLELCIKENLLIPGVTNDLYCNKITNALSCNLDLYNMAHAILISIQSQLSIKDTFY